MEPNHEDRELLAEWYIEPKPTIRRAWCVFSRQFVLESMQGCLGKPSKVRHTHVAECLAALIQFGMLCVQIPTMVLARIPVLTWMVEFIASSLGRNPLGFVLRASYYRATLGNLGQDTLVDKGVTIWGGTRISIGARCIVGYGVQISCGESPDKEDPATIKVGDHCFLGPGVFVGGNGKIDLGDMVSLSAGVRVYSATSVTIDLTKPGQLLSMSHAAPENCQKAGARRGGVEGLFVCWNQQHRTAERRDRRRHTHPSLHGSKQIVPCMFECRRPGQGSLTWHSQTIAEGSAS